MKRKRMLLKLLIVMSFVLIVGTGCLNENNKTELKTGKYAMENHENIAWVTLKEDNKFEFNRSLSSSYTPTGDYKIENNLLKLIAGENKIYTFEIKEDKLIFKGSNTEGYLVENETVFRLLNN